MFNADRLHSALVSVGADPAPQLFNQLKDMYTEAGRYYHTDRHIVECLGALDQHAGLSRRPGEIEIAIWFHDAIYDSRKPDNEEQSAALAATTLEKLSVPVATIERIESMILATKSHLAEDPDTELLLDIDLGILGQAPTTFARYDAWIRKEYSWVPEDQYRSGRAAVLRSFLDRERIYTTDVFRELYEDQARKNLALRLKELEA